MDPILSLIIGFVFGLLFFFYDLRGGKKLYRKWHDLSNKDPLEDASEKGFVYQQPFSKKLIPAVVIFIVFSLLLFYTGNLNPIEILISGSLLLAATMLAFYLGPLLLNILPSKLKQANKVIEKIDELEASVKSEFSEDKKIRVKEKSEKEAVNKTEEKTISKEKSNKDWRDGIQDFLDK